MHGFLPRNSTGSPGLGSAWARLGRRDSQIFVYVIQRGSQLPTAAGTPDAT